MTLAELLATLKSKGKPGAARIYKKHGVRGAAWGVSYGDLGTLVKKIKVDHDLALGLWANGVHDARVARLSMNGALIAIGGGIPSLRKDALAAAKAIGSVEVDHGETSCKTPDAASYIAKMTARAETKTKANETRSAAAKLATKKRAQAKKAVAS